jgi:hypothetical protein
MSQSTLFIWIIATIVASIIYFIEPVYNVEQKSRVPFCRLATKRKFKKKRIPKTIIEVKSKSIFFKKSYKYIQIVFEVKSKSKSLCF